MLPFVIGSGLLILMWLYKKNNEKHSGREKAKTEDNVSNPE